MYPKDVLTRYGESLEEPDKTAFLQVVQGLATEIHDSVEVVMGGALSVAMADSNLEHLCSDLAERWINFVDPKTDLPQSASQSS